MNKNSQWSLSFRYAMGFLIFIALVAFVIYARDAIRNLVIAAFVAYLISPVVEYLSTRTKLSHKAAVNIVYFSTLVLLVGVPATLTPIFYDEVQTVIKDVLHVSNTIGTTLSKPVQFANLTFHLEAWGKSLTQTQQTILTPLPEEVLKLLETTSVGALWFLVIMVSVYLFMSDWSRMREGLLAWVLPPYRAEMEELYKRIRRVWMAYLRGQIVLMIVVGIVFTVAWTVLGIPGALVLGVVAGLFTLVPDVGPFIAAMLATSVALLEGSTWIPFSNFWVAVIVFAVYLVLISLKNLLLRPIIMGRSVHMNEGLIFIAIIIATILDGILGALLIVPLIASVLVIVSYIQRKVLGMTPFEDDGNNEFIVPLEQDNPPSRKTRAKKISLLDGKPASFFPQVDTTSQTESKLKRTPSRKKTTK